MFILLVELNLAKCRLPKKVQNLFLSFESSKARKISPEGGGIQDPGNPELGKVRRGEKFFFPSSRGATDPG